MSRCTCIERDLCHCHSLHHAQAPQYDVWMVNIFILREDIGRALDMIWRRLQRLLDPTLIAWIILKELLYNYIDQYKSLLIIYIFIM